MVICQGDNARSETVLTMHHVGLLVRDGTRRVTGMSTWGIAVEQTFIHNSQDATLSLARNQGRLVGPSEMHAIDRKPLFVIPGSWRKMVLPKAYKNLVQPIEVPTKGKEAGKAKPGHYAKAASIRFVPLRLPLLIPWMNAVRRLHGVRPTQLDHCTDAGGVALYGALRGTNA